MGFVACSASDDRRIPTTAVVGHVPLSGAMTDGPQHQQLTDLLRHNATRVGLLPITYIMSIKVRRFHQMNQGPCVSGLSTSGGYRIQSDGHRIARGVSLKMAGRQRVKI